MGHLVDNVSRMFSGVSYSKKTTAELLQAFEKKSKQLKENIVMRDQRVLSIREEYHIDAEKLADLVIQYQQNSHKQFISYASNSKRDRPLDGNEVQETVIPVGVVANILKEKQMISSEQEQLEKIELVTRNLRQDEMEWFVNPSTGETGSRKAVHSLTDDELQYLGF